MKRALAANLLSRSGLLSLLGLAMRWSGVLCLNYHRIGDGSLSLFDRAVWSADAAGFDAHVQFLKTHFDVVTPHDLPDLLRRRRGRSVLITFDDGYVDQYDTAFPILKRHGVSATFFVPVGFLDHHRVSWWDEIAWMVRTSRKAGVDAGPWIPTPVVYDEPDRESAVESLLRVYKAMPTDSTGAYLDFLAEATGSGRFSGGQDVGPWMTWDMLREMRTAGMVAGAHTVNHPILAQLSPERQWEEISKCGLRFTEELGEPMQYFSYPDGGRSARNDDTRACLRRVGVRYAFSYYGGFRRFDEWDDLDVRRIGIEHFMNPDWVRAVVTQPGLFGRARR